MTSFGDSHKYRQPLNFLSFDQLRSTASSRAILRPPSAYRINGLRHGALQVLWFSPNDQGYTQPAFARMECYRDIKVMRGQIRKFLGTGKSPAQQARNNPSLSEADLKKWYRALKPTEQGLPIDKLVALAKDTHSTLHVSRQAVRRVIGSRRRGRPKKSAT